MVLLLGNIILIERSCHSRALHVRMRCLKKYNNILYTNDSDVNVVHRRIIFCLFSRYIIIIIVVFFSAVICQRLYITATWLINPSRVTIITIFLCNSSVGAFYIPRAGLRRLILFYYLGIFLWKTIVPVEVTVYT